MIMIRTIVLLSIIGAAVAQTNNDTSVDYRVDNPCLEWGALDDDCCAAIGDASCTKGYTYTMGADCAWGFAFKTICTYAGQENGEAVDVGEAFDYSECDNSQCTSTDGWFGQDCWAGSLGEGCTCGGELSAKATGATAWAYDSSGGTTHYEYTCCPAQSASTGEFCGDYDPALAKTIGIIVAAVVGTCFGCGLLGTLIFFVCYAKQHQNVTGPSQNVNNNPNATFQHTTTITVPPGMDAGVKPPPPPYA